MNSAPVLTLEAVWPHRVRNGLAYESERRDHLETEPRALSTWYIPAVLHHAAAFHLVRKTRFEIGNIAVEILSAFGAENNTTTWRTARELVSPAPRLDRVLFALNSVGLLSLVSLVLRRGLELQWVSTSFAASAGNTKRSAARERQTREWSAVYYHFYSPFLISRRDTISYQEVAIVFENQRNGQ
jgi:hypothetical protein